MDSMSRRLLGGMLSLPESRTSGNLEVCAIASYGWLCVAYRREEMDDSEVGPILLEVKARKRPERRDIANCYPTYSGYRAQWNLLVVKDGMLKHHWESAD
jgi:hypothetical protein